MHAFSERRIRRWPNRIELMRDIPYASGGARHSLDVCRPRSAAAAPVVVFFYGGGWRSGRKEAYRFAARALARRGYVAILPDYRIYPEVKYPDFLDDGAHAVRWVKNNAVQFGGDPEKIFLMGHSAGAHIAAMLSVDWRWLRNVGLVPSRDIAGLIGVAGPYDFLPLREGIYKTIFGGNRAETQPISHVARGAPAALLVTGDRDNIVDPGNSTRLAERLRAAGNDATVRIYPRIGHFGIVAALAPILSWLAPVLRDTDNFIARVIQARHVHLRAVS
jgi:acetyl esterase/lipase